MVRRQPASRLAERAEGQGWPLLLGADGVVLAAAERQTSAREGERVSVRGLAVIAMAGRPAERLRAALGRRQPVAQRPEGRPGGWSQLVAPANARPRGASLSTRRERQSCGLPGAHSAGPRGARSGWPGRTNGLSQAGRQTCELARGHDSDFRASSPFTAGRPSHHETSGRKTAGPFGSLRTAQFFLACSNAVS